MKLNALTHATVDTLPAGEHADGLGLYLIVKPTGGRSWMFKFTWAGDKKKMGLGSAALVTLDQARNLALDARKMINAGNNPLLARQARPEQRSSPNFLEYARKVAAIKTVGMKPKSADAWTRSIDYVKPLHKKELASITKKDVVDALSPIWLTIPISASNARGKLEAIFRYAIAHDDLLISHDRNPAGQATMRELLPKQPKVGTARGGHKSLPYREIAAFWNKLLAMNTTSSQTLQFAILTCVRAKEAIQLQWDQLDLDAGRWDLPPELRVMKNGLGANVPLSSDAVALLRQIQALHLAAGFDVTKGFVFRGQDHLTTQGTDTLLKLLQVSLGYSDVTVHGFRSTFKTWIGEQTSHDRDTQEHCLHHITGEAAEEAYKRGDFWEKRQHALQDWADVVTGRAPIAPVKRRSAKLALVA